MPEAAQAQNIINAGRRWRILSAFIRHFEQRKELTRCATSLDLASIYCARPLYRETLFSFMDHGRAHRAMLIAHNYWSTLTVLLDVRTYTCKPALSKRTSTCMKKWKEPQTRNLGQPLAYPTTETGNPNQYVHIWVYDNAGTGRRSARRCGKTLIDRLPAGDVSAGAQENKLMVPALFPTRDNAASLRLVADLSGSGAVFVETIGAGQFHASRKSGTRHQRLVPALHVRKSPGPPLASHVEHPRQSGKVGNRHVTSQIFRPSKRLFSTPYMPTFGVIAVDRRTFAARLK